MRDATVCAKHLYIKVSTDLSPYNSMNTAHMNLLLRQAALEWRKDRLTKVLRLAELLESELEDEDR